MASNPGDPYGWFEIPYKSVTIKVMACAGELPDLLWDHVSVSLENRCPNWTEMSYVKDLFFGEDETVVQFHPKKSEHVNVHPHCLHLWKRIGEEYELPPTIYV